MVEAIIQGEYHVSRSDRESLDKLLTDDIDALFIEGRKDNFSPDDWTFGYLSFLIGAMIIFWGQAIPNRGNDIKENLNIPIHDEIDTSLPMLYPQLPTSWKVTAGLVGILLFSAGLYMPTWQVPIVTVPETANQIYNITIKTVLIIGAPVSYSIILIILEELRLGKRDKDMAMAITQICADRGYKQIVISCGDAHTRRLSTLLENSGIEVRVKDSNHK